MRIHTFIILAIALAVCSGLHARDPMRPPTAAEIRTWLSDESGQRSHSPWQLQSVLIASDRRIAVINGQRKRIGDTINGAGVLSIEPGRVTLDTGSDQITLTINSRTTSWREPSRD